VLGSTTKPIGFELVELFGISEGMFDSGGLVVSTGGGVTVRGICKFEGAPPAVFGLGAPGVVLNGAKVTELPVFIPTSIGWTLI
jgi:hypothetical protein